MERRRRLIADQSPWHRIWAASTIAAPIAGYAGAANPEATQSIRPTPRMQSCSNPRDVRSSAQST
jgi:hypothetical protein